MGKRVKRLALLLIALLLPTLCACGASYADDWGCAYVELSDGSVMTAGDLDNAGSEMYFKLRVDGNGTFYADGESQNIRWYRQDDDYLVLIVDGNNELFRVEDEALAWQMDGATVRFLRMDSEAYEQALSESSLANWSAAG